MKNYPTKRWQDVWRRGRIIREWYRLKPEYGEQLHLTRADMSKGWTFYDTIQIFVNWKIWRGLYMKPRKDPVWGWRFAGCDVALPFYYKAEYEWCQMGQHRFRVDFRFLHVLYVRWTYSRDLSDEFALRFKRRYGKDVHPYARVQTEGR